MFDLRQTRNNRTAPAENVRKATNTIVCSVRQEFPLGLRPLAKAAKTNSDILA
jgi:hypothetical protein